MKRKFTAMTVLFTMLLSIAITNVQRADAAFNEIFWWGAVVDIGHYLVFYTYVRPRHSPSDGL